MAIAVDDQIGIGIAFWCTKQGLIAYPFVNKAMDEPLSLGFLFRFAKCSSFFSGRWKLDDFIVVATPGIFHEPQSHLLARATVASGDSGYFHRAQTHPTVAPTRD